MNLCRALLLKSVDEMRSYCTTINNNALFEIRRHWDNLFIKTVYYLNDSAGILYAFSISAASYGSLLFDSSGMLNDLNVSS